MNNENKDNSYYGIEEGREYEIDESSYGYHPVHPSIQTR